MPDDKPSPAESRQLDFLLADLGALKTEIARRAGLQRLALALYLALVTAVAGSLLVGKNLAVVIAGLWMGGLLALLFWCREHLEISRLGCLISHRIAKKAGAILGVPEADLVPSEVTPTVDEAMDRATHRYHVAFMWLALFVTPLVLTLHALWQRLDQLAELRACNTPAPYLALVGLGCMAGSVWLLVRRCSLTDAAMFRCLTDASAASLTREEYFAERRMLIEARQRGYQRAEQMVLGGATGSLVLSVTFLEKLVPAAKAVSTGLLSSAWLVLLGCLSLSLFGQYSSARAFGCEIARLEAQLHSEPLPRNRWATCNVLCGAISAMLLVVGIALLALFAYVNAPFHGG